MHRVTNDCDAQTVPWLWCVDLFWCGWLPGEIRHFVVGEWMWLVARCHVMSCDVIWCVFILCDAISCVVWCHMMHWDVMWWLLCDATPTCENGMVSSELHTRQAVHSDKLGIKTWPLKHKTRTQPSLPKHPTQNGHEDGPSWHFYNWSMADLQWTLAVSRPLLCCCGPQRHATPLNWHLTMQKKIQRNILLLKCVIYHKVYYTSLIRYHANSAREFWYYVPCDNYPCLFKMQCNKKPTHSIESQDYVSVIRAILHVDPLKKTTKTTSNSLNFMTRTRNMYK